MTSQQRQPAGVPVGGQFAPSTHAEAGVALAPDGPVEIRRGVWEVACASSRTSAVADGLEQVEVRPDGIAEIRAQSGMVSLRVERAEQSDATLSKLIKLAGEEKKATVLVARPNGDVQAVEGQLHLHQSGHGVALLSKGQSSKGEWLTRSPQMDSDPGSKVLAVRPGYGHAAELAAVWADHAAKCPELTEATFEGIPQYEGRGEPPRDIAAVYVIEHPGFDGSQDGRGTVLFVTDRQADGPNDPYSLVNGYMVFPPGSGMDSESGSMYERDVARFGGRVTAFEPGSLTFSDAMDFANRASSYHRPGPEGDWQSDGGDIEAVWEALAGRRN